MWLLPISMLIATVVLAIPLSRYLAWIMNGEYHAPRFLKWFEDRLDAGNQNWQQYTAALLIFNILLFSYSYLVMFVQPRMPLNPLHRGMLAPTTIAHAAMSLSTNTDLQHWSGDVQFSNFTQIFAMIANFFFSVYLREKIRDNPHRPRFIETVHQRSYPFIATVAAVDSDGPTLIAFRRIRDGLNWGLNTRSCDWLRFLLSSAGNQLSSEFRHRSTVPARNIATTWPELCTRKAAVEKEVSLPMSDTNMTLMMPESRSSLT